MNSLDNAFKGNDSVSIASGTYVFISRAGDGIKTSSTDLSSKNVQRGTVTISGGNITIYAACDGIDAAAFCKQFGGGGHPAASGCSIQGSLSDVKFKLIEAAEAYL